MNPSPTRYARGGHPAAGDAAWAGAGRAGHPRHGDPSHRAGRRVETQGTLAESGGQCAVKYSRPGGKVEISLVSEGNTARLSVLDHGIGIPLEEQVRIFDRFYRADAARAHAKKGTGLGLSICKWIAEAHHGRIEVQSTEGDGSQFTVILPLAPTSP
ncbi:MAG: cell wall metabolism sensor histidine kinase WalK [Nitrospirae bacterium]|nr:MAG: cell wall metabolism sensor histidine kinase WalK [Nitrospirota bacterium]